MKDMSKESDDNGLPVFKLDLLRKDESNISTEENFQKNENGKQPNKVRKKLLSTAKTTVETIKSYNKNKST